MDQEGLLNLFDFCWFELQIFKKQPVASISPLLEPNPDPKIEESSSKSELSSFPSIHTRSMSDQLSSNTSFDSSSLSPHSVLLSPKLQTILSGKEITEERTLEKHEEALRVVGRIRSGRGRRRKKGESKSLSDLEFQEPKGFMDLGFVFSEEDKDSSLVEIIPGLQRLGKKDGEEERGDLDHESSAIPRPYLSEAWEGLERRRRREVNPLTSWKIPALSNEIDMKDSLRWWAHTVASSVR